MRLNTSSAIITFVGQLEEKSASLYENLAAAYPKEADFFLGLARENRKNKVQVERAYYGVITDAIEGSFAFDLEVDGYILDYGEIGTPDHSVTLAKAVETEEKITAFYKEAARQSMDLLADLPRVFTMMAKKRDARLAKLLAVRLG